MPLDQVIEVSIIIAGVTSIALEIIKAIAIDPYFPDSPQRTGVLRGLNFLLNLGLLLGYLGVNGALNGADFINYLALAFGQSIGSHAVQQTFSGSGPVSEVASRLVKRKYNGVAVMDSDVGGDVEPPAV